MPFQICRVCYKRGYNLLTLEADINNYPHKLSSCVPEIDIYIIDKPGICKKCADMLDVAYEFREICLENEKRYNDTFNQKTIDSGIAPNNVLIDDSNSREVSKENDLVNNNKTLDTEVNEEMIDEQNLLVDVSIESTTFCNVCNREFKSSHDKRAHDRKLHRELKHRILKEFLPPIVKNIEETTYFECALENNSVTISNNNKYNLSDDQNIRETSENLAAKNLKHISVHENESTDPENLKCKTCSMKFLDPCELESHILIHIENLCEICGKTFNERNELDNHMKLHFTKCCGESFSTASLLQLHTYKEHNTTCGICDEKFNQFSSLFHHLLDHIGDNWFKCNICGKQFKVKCDLENHTCDYFTCKHCRTLYFTKRTYIAHMESHKEEASDSSKILMTRKYQCSKCNIRCKTRGQFMRHFHSHEKKHQKQSIKQTCTYVCDLCSNQFQLYIHLKMHILQIHCNKLTIPIVDCRKDEFYKQQEGLRINFEIPHEYTGNNIENFSLIKRELSNRSKRICFKCRIMFPSRVLLITHAKKKHQICCNEEFKDGAMFVKHNFSHYNENERDGIHEEIKCGICMKVFRNFTSVLSHSCNTFLCTIEDHENDSDACDGDIKHCINIGSSVCEICKKQFECKTSLLQHIATHI